MVGMYEHIAEEAGVPSNAQCINSPCGIGQRDQELVMNLRHAIQHQFRPVLND